MRNLSKEQQIVSLALKGAETVNVELKIKYDLSTDKSEFLRDIVALSNPFEEDGVGDIAYLIIGAKNGKIFDVSELNLEESDIRSIVHTYIFPKINLTFHQVEHQGNKIIGIEIVRTDDLYLIQKRCVTVKKKRINSKEEEVNDIVVAGECWTRLGTAKKQLSGEEIVVYHSKLFKKKTNALLLPLYERIDALETKIKDFEEAQPKVDLRFDNGQSTISVKLKQKFRKKKDWIQEKLEVLKSYRPKIDPENPNAEPRSLSTTLGSFARITNDFFKIGELSNPLLRITEEEAIDYNAELDVYYEKLSEYAEALYGHLKTKRATALIILRLSNEGKTPARDLIVEVNIEPDSIEHYCFNSVKLLKAEEPKQPTSPEHPINAKNVTSAMRLRSLVTPRISPPSLSRPKSHSRQTKVSKTRLIFTCDKLNHGRTAEIKVALTLTGISAVCSLAYRITAENIRETISGKLTVFNEEKN